GTAEIFIGGKDKVIPEKVFSPESTDDVVLIVKEAIKKKWNIVPRGAGTGLTGGAYVTEKRSIVVDLSKMNRFLEISKDDRYCNVEPGITGKELEGALNSQGFYFPPSPASYLFSTIGGNIAENSGGLKAVRHGVTRDFLMALDVVTGNGDIINIGQFTEKSVSGYNLLSLFCGSEGTLGIITGAVLRIANIPRFKMGCIAFFKDYDTAFHSVRELFSSGIIPASIEFVDELSIKAASTFSDLNAPAEAKAFILFELEGNIKENIEREFSTLLKIIEKFSFRIYSDESINDITSSKNSDIWEIRKSISPALLNMAEVKINEDICVPRSRMTEMLSFISEISAEENIPIASFGHAGDGNLHINLLLEKDLPERRASAHKVVKKIFQKC
ncbi:MAG: FAD-binding protein, partial [Actinomycetia bacterium]|nr:FAD-binding protein [Actinomycetes bacterium]